MEESMGLQDILKVIKKRLLLIITLTMGSVSIAIFLNYYVLTPIYQVETQILVNQKGSEEEANSRLQIDRDLQLINTYNNIITSPLILNKVIEELDLDTTPEQLAYQFALSNENQSKVFYIGVIDSDQELAVNIANTTAEIFKEEIPKLLNIDNINIISPAKISENLSPITPNKKANIAIGAVIGLMLGVLLTFLLEVLDTTIKDEKDVEGFLGMPLIGIIGTIPLKKEKKSSFKSRRVRGNQDAWNPK